MTIEAYIEENIFQHESIMAFFKNDDDSQRPIEEWLFASSALGIGDNLPVPPRPYIVTNELTDLVHVAVKETSDSRNRNFQWFVYDHKGDFTRINEILHALRPLVKEIAPFRASDGTWCSDSHWSGISGQSTDDGYDSCVKFATVRFTVNQ